MGLWPRQRPQIRPHRVILQKFKNQRENNVSTKNLHLVWHEIYTGFKLWVYKKRTKMDTIIKFPKLITSVL